MFHMGCGSHNGIHGLLHFRRKAIPATTCSILGRIVHLQTALRSQWDKCQKNNSLFASPSIRRPTSGAAFSHQDITEFESLAITLRQKILTDLEPLYAKHRGLYITPECLENPDIPPMIYCQVNHCVWQDGKWIPMELANAAQPKEKSA